MDVAREVMEANDVTTEVIRAVDHTIAPGVYPDMTEVDDSGVTEDDWPAIWPKVEAADILVLGTPIWLGEVSSEARKVVERLYAHSGQLSDAGQYIYYGKIGGCIITGNEDGIKHCASNLLYALQHIGYTIPPQADAGWIGPAGPGPSYLDEESGGQQNDFTQRNTTFMAWNLMHMAHILKARGGLPAWGNLPEQWDEGADFDHPNPEYR